MKSKSKLIGFLVITLMIMVGISELKSSTVEDQTHSSTSKSDGQRESVNVEEEVEIYTSLFEIPAYVGVPSSHIAAADNVFVGKVIRKIGDGGEVYYSPSTLYEVAPVDNIKGDLSKTINLIQGGVGYIDGKLFATEDDITLFAENTDIKPEDIFLKTGAIYLFITAYDPKADLYGISVPPHDRALITTDVSLSGSELQSVIDQNSSVQTWRNAYEDWVERMTQ